MTVSSWARLRRASRSRWKRSNAVVARLRLIGSSAAAKATPVAITETDTTTTTSSNEKARRRRRRA